MSGTPPSVHSKPITLLLVTSEHPQLPRKALELHGGSAQKDELQEAFLLGHTSC